jgi:hypothetical protein
MLCYAVPRSAAQGQGQLKQKMVFQPASLASTFHKRLTAMVDKQHIKQNKVGRRGAGLGGEV